MGLYQAAHAHLAAAVDETASLGTAAAAAAAAAHTCPDNNAEMKHKQPVFYMCARTHECTHTQTHTHILTDLHVMLK